MEFLENKLREKSELENNLVVYGITLQASRLSGFAWEWMKIHKTTKFYLMGSYSRMLG